MPELTISLKEHVEALLLALRQHADEQNAAHIRSHEEALRSGLMFWDNHKREHESEHAAVKERQDAMNVRLNGMNEIRGQMRDQQGTFLTREVYDERHEALLRRVEMVERWQTLDQGARQRGDKSTRYWIAIAGIAVTAAVVVVNVLVKIF